jgi:hypothetical protein
MPSEQSTWLIAVPSDGDSEGVIEELAGKLGRTAVAPLPIPSFKVTQSPPSHLLLLSRVDRDP